MPLNVKAPRIIALTAIFLLAIVFFLRQPFWQASPPQTQTVVPTEQRSVNVYLYDAKKDTDAAGNILCSEKGLVAVSRTIPQAALPVREAVELLLKGQLTEEERAQGIATEFPLSGLELVAASVEAKTLTLTFADPQQKTSGGSCRVSVLRAQIEATAKQFEEISRVEILPNTLFQP